MIPTTIQGPLASSTVTEAIRAGVTVGVIRDLNRGDQELYKAQVLDAGATVEYILWAANNASPVWHPSWWVENPSSIIREDLTHAFIVDASQRFIETVTHLIVARADVTYNDNGWVDEEDPSQGRLGSVPYDVVTVVQNRQNSNLPARVQFYDVELTDTIVDCRYTLQEPQFYWSRNDSTATRFGCNHGGRWEPYKGSPPVLLGTIYSGATFTTAKGLTSPQFLYGGTDADPASRLTVTLSNTITYDSTQGTITFNDDTLAGQILWHYPSSWDVNATGIMGTFSASGTLVLTPAPSGDEYPLIRIGSRSYLNVIFRDTENDTHTYLQEGDVLVTRSTGTLTFSNADLARIGNDDKYTDQFVVYDGVSMTVPLAMDAIETLTVPATMALYNVADGSGVAPRLANPASKGRRGGSGTGTNPAYVKSAPTHGTTAVFTKSTVATNIVTLTPLDVTPNVFDVEEGTVYVDLDTSTLILPPSMAEETTVYSRTCHVTLPDTGLTFGFPAEVLTVLYTTPTLGDAVTAISGVDRVFLAEAPLLDYPLILTSRGTELTYNQDYTFVADNDKALAWLKPVVMATTTTEPTQQIGLGAPNLIGLSVQTGTPLQPHAYVNQDGILSLTTAHGPVMASGSGGTLTGSVLTPTAMPSAPLAAGMQVILTDVNQTRAFLLDYADGSSIHLTESQGDLNTPIVAWECRAVNKIVDQNWLYVDLDHTGGPTITLQRYREGFTETPNTVNSYGVATLTSAVTPLTIVDSIDLGRMAATIDLSTVDALNGIDYATLTFVVNGDNVLAGSTIVDTTVTFDSADVTLYNGYVVYARQTVSTAPTFQRWNNTYVNVTGYTHLVKTLTSDDVTCRPLSGTFGLTNPALSGDMYKATYYKATSSGGRTGDSTTEFMTSQVINEVATRTSANVYTFAPDKTILSTDATIVVKGPQTLVAGTDYNLQGKEIHFIDAVGVGFTDTIYVSYTTPSMNGGEIALASVNKPLYSPPFFIPAGRDYVGLRGDRTSDFETGQLLRIGSDCIYVTNVEYFPNSDATKVSIYPSTTSELGSRSPGNAGTITLKTLGAVSHTTSPEEWSDALTVTHADKGGTKVTLASMPSTAVAVGGIVELAGVPYVIAAHSGTELTLASPLVTSATTAYVSTAPIYPATSTTPLALGPILSSDDEPFTLIQGFEVLTEGTDYAVDVTTGQIRLKGDRTLQSGTLYAYYLSADVLPANTYVEITGYGRTTEAPAAPLMLSATARTPMIFYARALPLADYASEDVATQSLTYSTSASNRKVGLTTTASVANATKAAERIARRAAFEHYENLRGYYTVTEIMTGTLVGGLDGKLKTWFGDPTTMTPVRGYEDPVTGDLLPRNAYETYMRTVGGNQFFLNEAYDDLYTPASVAVSAYEMSGDTPTPVDKDTYKLAQQSYVMNDVTDLVLDDSANLWNPKDRMTQAERIATATVDTSLVAVGSVLGAFDNMSMGMSTPIVNRRVARARVLSVHPTGIPSLGITSYCIVASPDDCQSTYVVPTTLVPTFATSAHLLSDENVLNIPGFAVGDELWTDQGPLYVFNSLGEQVTATIQSIVQGHVITLADTYYVAGDLSTATSLFAAPKSYVTGADVGVDYKGAITSLSLTPPSENRMEAYALTVKQPFVPPAANGSSLSDTYERSYPVSYRTDAEAVTLEYLCKMIPEILETPALSGPGPMYGDEILTTATLDTGSVVLADPIAGGLTGDYARDAQEYDVVLIETGGSVSGTQSIGSLVSPTEIKLPVFVTPTDVGYLASYALTNALVFLNDTYPVDPQATPPDGVTFEMDANTTTFTFPTSTVSLSDLGNLINYSSGNLLRITLYAREDPSITASPTPSAGDVLLVVECQNGIMTTVGAWAGATPIMTPYSALATSAHTLTLTHAAPSPDTIELVAPANEWHVPYAPGGATTSLYGYECSITLVLAASLTAYVMSDRCTFIEEALSLANAKATGTKHPLYVGTDLGLVLGNLYVTTPSGMSTVNNVNPTFLDAGIVRSVPYADHFFTPNVRVVPSSLVLGAQTGTYKEPATILTSTLTNVNVGDIVRTMGITNKGGTYKITGVENRATTTTVYSFPAQITLLGITTDQNTLYTSTAIPDHWPTASGRIYIVRNAANITGAATADEWLASVCSVTYNTRTGNTFNTLTDWKNLDGTTLTSTDVTTFTDLAVLQPVSHIPANPYLALVEGTATVNSVALTTGAVTESLAPLDVLTPNLTYYDLSTVADFTWESLNNPTGYPITTSGYARFVAPASTLAANVTYVKGVSLTPLDAPPTNQTLASVTSPSTVATTEAIYYDIVRTKRYAPSMTSPMLWSTYRAQTTTVYSFSDQLPSGCGSIIVDTPLTLGGGSQYVTDDTTGAHRCHILASNNVPVSVPDGFGGGGFVSVIKQRLIVEPNAHWTPQNGDTITLSGDSYQEALTAMLAGQGASVTLTGASLASMAITGGTSTTTTGDIVVYQGHPYKIILWDPVTTTATMTTSPFETDPLLKNRSTQSPNLTLALASATATLYHEPSDLTKKALLLQSELTYWLDVASPLLDEPSNLASTTLASYAYDSTTLIAILGDTRTTATSPSPASTIQRRAKLNGDRRLKALGPLTPDVTYTMQNTTLTPYTGVIRHV